MSDAADKLARTRLAIIEHVHRKKHPDEYQTDSKPKARRIPKDVHLDARGELQEGPAEVGQLGRRAATAKSWLASGQRALGAWWRHHPAHLGVELATPMLSSFAGRRPVIYLGAAALLGAVIVVARPWRLISVTGLVVAVVKSSQLSSMVMSALSAADFEKDDRRPYQ